MSKEHAGLVVVGVDGTAESDAALALVEAARTARLLVVGSRALGYVRAALLGSVSRYCAHHAAVPVVVVPAAQPSHEHGTQALERVGTATTP
jgi:nucleotide-binding universal stress UspA family protein